MRENSVRTPREAILVMDSRSSAPAVRHQNFGGSWTKLYKAGEFYLDLSFKPDEAGAVLTGQVIAEGGQPLSPDVTLFGPDQGVVGQGGPDGLGRFRLELNRPGQHHLTLRVGEETFAVRGLELN